jgi:predicted dehydrogenase
MEQSISMTEMRPTRVAFVGSGKMARWHLLSMLRQQSTTQVTAICEPSDSNYAETVEVFQRFDLEAPPHVPSLNQLLDQHLHNLDAVFIITPHAYHHDHAKTCLEAGLDVLLEKPMVMNASEARSLMEIRDRTGRLLVVSFQGSLSPAVRTAVKMLRSGETGPILNISGTVWQNWKEATVGSWRVQPELSGGGFLFDTGAHVLNTIADLAGQDFEEVAAWMDNRGLGVEILGAVIGRLKSGALVTINACGDTIPSCWSDIRIFCTEAILRTTMWGDFLEVQRRGDSDLQPVDTAPSMGVWEQFLAVRQGLIENPSPAEVGLRMAYLYDAIKASAAQHGAPVKCVYDEEVN